MDADVEPYHATRHEQPDRSACLERRSRACARDTHVRYTSDVCVIYSPLASCHLLYGAYIYGFMDYVVNPHLRTLVLHTMSIEPG